MKMFHFDKIRDVINQMMDTPIFPCLKNEVQNMLDPNLIMDARHKIHEKRSAVKLIRNNNPIEFKKTSERNERKNEYLQRKQEESLKMELLKLENKLEKTRSKFSSTSNCSKNIFVHLEDEDFWRTSSLVKVKKLLDDSKTLEQKNKTEEMITRDDSIITNDVNEEKCPTRIKVTITDKLNEESERRENETMRMIFDILKYYANEKKRLRNIKRKILIKSSKKKLREHFNLWREQVKKLKSITKKENNNNKEIEANEQKIEMLINTITRKQKELPKNKNKKSADISTSPNLEEKITVEEEKRKRLKRAIIESPAQCRLNAQKKIIEQQKLQLVEQNKIIEELKMKQLQSELRMREKNTISLANEALTNCGQSTRRTLVQIMKQEGYADKHAVSPPRTSNPPLFLSRMEARVQARKERVKRAEEARRKRLEEEKRKEEIARRDKAEQIRRLQQETLREARKLREEQERLKLSELRRFRNLNEKADAFYRKYLIRHYIMEPFISLVEMKNRYMQKAEDLYRRNLMKKIFNSWKLETENQIEIKNKLVFSMYDRNLLWYSFKNWQETWKQTRRKTQVSKDFYDLRLLDKSFKSWRSNVLKIQLRHWENEQLAQRFYRENLKRKHIELWKKYVQLADEINESEKRKNKWRQIVQEIIPDFAPKQRGVALDD